MAIFIICDQIYSLFHRIYCVHYEPLTLRVQSRGLVFTFLAAPCFLTAPHLLAAPRLLAAPWLLGQPETPLPTVPDAAPVSGLKVSQMGSEAVMSLSYPLTNTHTPRYRV